MRIAGSKRQKMRARDNCARSCVRDGPKCVESRRNDQGHQRFPAINSVIALRTSSNALPFFQKLLLAASQKVLSARWPELMRARGRCANARVKKLIASNYHAAAIYCSANLDDAHVRKVWGSTAEKAKLIPMQSFEIFIELRGSMLSSSAGARPSPLFWLCHSSAHGLTQPSTIFWTN